jgi:urea transport system ATP-binding protein
MLTIEGLNQYYGQSRTLWDLGLEVPEGALVCLMGRNGVGKTTLLKCIMGLIADSRRQDQLRRRGYESPPGGTARPARHRLCAAGPADFSAADGRGKSANRPADPQGQAPQIPEFIYEMFPVLKTMLKRRGGDLSGGQQQQLAIGRALVLQPKMLILDEPTEGIQPNIVHDIGEVIRKLNREQGMTVLLVEQKLGFARQVADRFCIIDKGRAVAMGAMADLNDGLVKQYLTV